MAIKLNKFSKNITSQHGEDGILEYIVGCIGNKMERSVCEFGAWDGVAMSNTWNFWHNLGWDGVLIEGDPAKFHELMMNARATTAVAINAFVSIRGENSLDDIFEQNNLPTRIGILSIDIDSYDYHVWKNLEYVSPQIVVIEHNQRIPPHIDYFDPDGHVYLKCSAKALERLGNEKGYRLICCTESNSIFVKSDLFDPSYFPDMPVEWLFDYTTLEHQLVFTGEDGNKYPIFSNKAREERKRWARFYYRLSAFFKKGRRTFRRPPDEVAEKIRAAGMDV